jgi:hypothetical protein
MVYLIYLYLKFTALSQKIGKPNNLKVFGSYKAMGINRIAEIGSKVTYA